MYAHLVTITTTERATALATETTGAFIAEATTTITTTEGGATGAGGSLTVAGSVDLDIATIQFLAIHGLDGSLSLVVVGKGDEPEATGAAGFTVTHHNGIGDVTEAGEDGAKVVGFSSPSETSNK